MDEETQVTQEQTQNTGVEAGSGESTDVTLDSFLGDDGQGETPAPVVDKEAKKAADFERAYHKERENSKRLQEELSKFKTPPQPTETPALDPEKLAADPGVQLLRRLIREETQGVISPLTSQQEKVHREKVWGEFMEDPVNRTLAPQAQKAYAELPKTGDFAKDMDFAFNYTKGKYGSDIERAALEVGQEQGFKAKTLKQAGGMTGTPTVSGGKDDFASRYRRGELSTAEMREHADEIAAIDAADKQQGL